MKIAIKTANRAGFSEIVVLLIPEKTFLKIVEQAEISLN